MTLFEYSVVLMWALTCFFYWFYTKKIKVKIAKYFKKKHKKKLKGKKHGRKHGRK